MTRQDREQLSTEITSDLSGERLDRAISLRFGLGRKAAREAVQAGWVTLNGRVCRKGATLLRPGSTLEVLAPPAQLSPEVGAPLNILLETPLFVVASKPSGQPTAPLSTLELGSLAGALLGRYPEMQGVGYSPREPGILHRLDTETSGLVLAARSSAAFEELRARLELGELHKNYLAVVNGSPPNHKGSVETFLGPDPRRKGRVDIGGKFAAATDYEVLAQGNGKSLLELGVSHAYRHQIRVHMAYLGCALVGDKAYSDYPEDPKQRLALHASRIRLAAHAPYQFDVREDMPDELHALLGL